MQSILFYFKQPAWFFDSLVHHFGQWLPDSLYLKLRYRCQMGKRLDLKNPKTFSEKIQWLKLYDRNPEYTQMVDKITAKDYVTRVLGPKYVIPLLGVWNKPEDIDWESLPDKFVLKTNHSGGNTGVIICNDKATFDKEKAIKKLNASLKCDVYYDLREWPYKNVAKKVFAEQYVNPDPVFNDLPDYKFFCFNGEPKYCQVISGRGLKMCIDFFDKEWNHQPFHEPKDFQFADVLPQKPKQYSKMWDLAKKLAYDKPFSRIDFYEVNNQIYFGEITFYPTSGFGGFSPQEYDTQLGTMIILQDNNQQ